MRYLFTLTLLLVLLVSGTALAERVTVGATNGDVEVTVESSSSSRTVVRFDVGAFDQEAIDINGSTYYLIETGKEANLLIEGEPALPRISRSIIIPDDAEMKINVLDAEYVEFQNVPVAPSKGNLTRDINPDDVEYKFGSVYSTADWYPSRLASLREPYIMRDYRGIVIELNAFQYNPGTQTLRVYTSVTVEVEAVGPGTVNVINPGTPTKALTPDFDFMYRHRFINYSQAQKVYPSVMESGEMLVITYDDWADEMQPFVDWKMQKGIKTTMVNISTVGNTSTAIKNYIQAFYDSTNLVYVLLVGDYPQVTSPTASGGTSDPSYAKLAGSDDYPDAFIGRFSAENAGHVTTQVQRSIDYELNPVAGAWMHQGTGIASNQGPGHYGEYDNTHMDLIRGDLLGFTYTSVDQFYDPSATSSMVTSALNAGRSIINYCGHGSTTAWSTTGFNNTNVNALANNGMLPFIISVACVNGEFDYFTCFAEAWLRATHNGQPSGAVGAYMSSINQSWNPPMYAQDEAVDLLVAGEKTTFGGICYNGSCLTIEINGSGGVEIYNTWHIFGDPSLQVRTDIPAALSVIHEPIVLFTATSYDVTVGVEGALCALYNDGVLYGSAYTDGSGAASIQIDELLPVGEQLTLTVTSFNAETYTATVQSIAPSGPYVIFDASTVNDAAGNGNGQIDFGEDILVGLTLKNVGPDTAYGVVATVTSSDPYVEITDGTESYGVIAPDMTTSFVADGFAFSVDPLVPDGSWITFDLEVNGTARDTWTGTFRLQAHAPNVAYVSVAINDAVGGNGNGKLDPGESADLTVTVQNAGTGQAFNANAFLSTTDQYISIGDDYGVFGSIAADGGTANNSGDVYTVSAGEDCPMGHATTLTLDLGADGGYATTLYIGITVGDRVVAFADDFALDLGWSGYGGTAEWQRGPAQGLQDDPDDDHTAGASNWVAGNDLANDGDYNNNISSTQYLTSPVIDLSGFYGTELRFWQWLGCESSSYDHVNLQVYDGTQWVTLYNHSGATFQETQWSEKFHDISAYADSNAMFQIRFGMGTTDGSVTYSGWNIDDVEIKGYGHVGTPVMVMAEESLDITVQPGGTVDHGLWIKNEGDGTLRIAFSTDETWMSCSTDDVFIAQGDSTEFMVTLDCDGLDKAQYQGQLEYVSNDAIHPSGMIPVTLRIGCCQGTMVGNVDGSADDEVTLGDLTALIDALFVSLNPPDCLTEADLDYSGQPDPTPADITLSDLTLMVDFLFLTLSPLNSCP